MYTTIYKIGDSENFLGVVENREQAVLALSTHLGEKINTDNSQEGYQIHDNNNIYEVKKKIMAGYIYNDIEYQLIPKGSLIILNKTTIDKIVKEMQIPKRIYNTYTETYTNLSKQYEQALTREDKLDKMLKIMELMYDNQDMLFFPTFRHAYNFNLEMLSVMLPKDSFTLSKYRSIVDY